MRVVQIVIAIVCAVLLSQCGGVKSNRESGEEKREYAPGTRTMKRSLDNIYSVRTRAEYESMVTHYWDDFDFKAEKDVVAYDTVDIVYALSDYVTVIPPQHADSLLRTLIRRASESREVLNFFATISEMVLHDPNSPMRNDEYYIPILEEIIASPLLDEYDRIAPAYDLELARQNRIGNVANDIVYTLANGRTGRLHSIDSDYVIVMFSNPGCPMCREIIEEITSSPLINEMMENDLVEVLAVYPDEDLEAWYDYLETMPKGWICSYDKDMVISDNNLYDLKAIPSLYLLDRKKHVLIKDGVSVQHVEQLISQGVQL